MKAETKAALRAVHHYLATKGPARLVHVAEALEIPLTRVRYVANYMQDYGRISWVQNGTRFYWSGIPGVGIEDLL